MAGEKLETVEVKQVIDIGPQVSSFGEFLDLAKKGPKGSIATPFNIISLPIMLLGYVFILARLIYGVGPVSNLSPEQPWGLWIGFNVAAMVAFAGGSYVLSFMFNVLGIRKYQGIARAAVLNGFVIYLLAFVMVLISSSSWWNVANPGNFFGADGIMFVVLWTFVLYVVASFVQFSPVFAEWLGWKERRKIYSSITFGVAILGITLAVIHQTALGELLAMAKAKLHPLWYTPHMPVLFLVSSVFAGISMVIFESSISHKVFGNSADEAKDTEYKSMLVSLSKICAVTMFGYFFLRIVLAVREHAFQYLGSPMGAWWMIEVVGLVLIPCLMFMRAAQRGSHMLIRFAALLTMVGVIVNRLSYTFLAYNWNVPLSEKYMPSAMEIVISASVVLTGVWIFRWAVRRMPVLSEPPAWAKAMERN